MCRRWSLAGSLLLAVAGCASVPPQQLGQVIGTIAGTAIAPGIGAPLGGLVGMLAGMGVQHQVDGVTEKRERVELGQQLRSAPDAGGTPGLPMGQPTRVWVDETFQSGRLVVGHFEQRYLP